MKSKRNAVFEVKDLVAMLDDDFDTQVMAARRIWTDWDVIEEREILQDKAETLHGLLTENSYGRHSWHFMIALGCLEYEPAINNLINILENEEDTNLRGFAADALSRYPRKKITKTVENRLWERLKNDNSIVIKVNILRALKNYYKNSKNKIIAEKLIDLLPLQKHPVVATQLINTVGSIGSIESTPYLVHLLVARRVEVGIEVAANALDMIAKKNGFSNRKDLIKKFDFNSAEVNDI